MGKHKEVTTRSVLLRGRSLGAGAAAAGAAQVHTRLDAERTAFAFVMGEQLLVESVGPACAVEVEDRVVEVHGRVHGLQSLHVDEPPPRPRRRVSDVVVELKLDVIVLRLLLARRLAAVPVHA